jgi:sec-independent protein translocase protein TatA
MSEEQSAAKRNLLMTSTIASILNLGGSDLIIILLIVLLLFGAKKLPELARGMGRAVKEFGTARDEIEKGLHESGPSGVAQVKLLDTKASGNLRGSSGCQATERTR